MGNCVQGVPEGPHRPRPPLPRLRQYHPLRHQATRRRPGWSRLRPGPWRPVPGHRKLTLRAGYLYNTNPIKGTNTLFNIQAPGFMQQMLAMVPYKLTDDISSHSAWTHQFRNSIPGSILQIPPASLSSSTARPTDHRGPERPVRQAQETSRTMRSLRQGRTAPPLPTTPITPVERPPQPDLVGETLSSLPPLPSPGRWLKREHHPVPRRHRRRGGQDVNRRCAQFARGHSLMDRDRSRARMLVLLICGIVAAATAPGCAPAAVPGEDTHRAIRSGCAGEQGQFYGTWFT